MYTVTWRALAARELAYNFGAYGELFSQHAEFVATPGATPPDETNLPRWFFCEQWTRYEIGSLQQSGIDRQNGQQGRT
jgi:hypothetical protein